MADNKDYLGEGIMESFDPSLKRAFENAHETVDPAIMDRAAVKIRKDSILLSGDKAFYTLQGEGPTMGLPCVFLRLHVCNLACTWCDAFYTWDARSTEFWTEGSRHSFWDAADLVASKWEGPKDIPRRVIFTGGEPLIQKTQLEAVWNLLEGRSGQRWLVEVETNGTLMPTKTQLESWQFNCSPKLANSGNKDYSMVKPKIIKQLNGVNTTFKFVCMTEADLDEVLKVYGPLVDHDKIIIMPQGVLEEEVSMNARVLAEPCKERGLRIMPRLQNILWDGARRGV